MWYLFSKQAGHVVDGKKIHYTVFKNVVFEEGNFNMPQVNMPLGMREERPRIKKKYSWGNFSRISKDRLQRLEQKTPVFLLVLDLVILRI